MRKIKVIKEYDVDELYTIRGYVNDRKNVRYIQFSFYSGDPIIQTRLGYSAYNVVVFKSEIDAFKFLVEFVSSKDRKNKYNISWDIVPYKASAANDVDVEATYSEVNTKYGPCFRMSNIRTLTPYEKLRYTY